MTSSYKAVMAAGLWVGSGAWVQADDRAWFQGSTGNATASIDCGTNFLVSLTSQVRDRVVSVGGECMGTGALSPGVAWKPLPRDKGGEFSSAQFPPPIGKGTGALDNNTKRCPQDYFMVGLSTTWGFYSADTHGMAKPVPQPLLADLAPVCRNKAGAINQLNRGNLVGAEDNRLFEIGSDGENGQQSCPPGSAVSKVRFVYDGTPGLDPADRFYDVALTCRAFKGVPVNVQPK
jgi:hypothetical protein